MDIPQEFQGIIWSKNDWNFPKTNEETNKLLSDCIDLPSLEIVVDVNEIIRKSKSFPVPFPIETVRLKKLKASRPIQKLHKNIMSTYPLIHERVLVLMAQFLIYKRMFGSDIEKKLYKDMTVPGLIDRILKKRAVTFMGAYDRYKLLTGETGKEGWESVGTRKEKHPLTLDKCLSYDEMKISAMVYVSGPTECINDGSRHNAGVVREDDVEKDAIIIGLIGARFKRRFRMDNEDIVISEEQNTLENGYGEEVTSPNAAKQQWRRMWSEFYEVPSYIYEELTSKVKVKKTNPLNQYTDRYVKIKSSKDIFDNEAYYRRLSVIAESTLLEADARAAEAGKNAFVNVIGCGLGVWKISQHQDDVYVLSFLMRIRALLKKDMLNHITDVNFAYLKTSKSVLAMFTDSADYLSPKEKKILIQSKNHPNGGINVQLENREPSARLSGEHSGKLLVITYPWDGNAHPGNEFWINKLTSSGDPAAACSTQVSELHNAHINPNVSSARLMVAGRYGIDTLARYCTELTK